VTVPPVLIRRLKSHFITLPCGVDLILGLNGYIWVSKHVKQSKEGEEGFDAKAVYSNQNEVCIHSVFTRPSLKLSMKPIDGPTRVAITRVTNIIRTLATHFVPLTDVLLLDAYEWVVDNQDSSIGVLSEESTDALLAALALRG
jgi:exosome complex component RRP4